MPIFGDVSRHHYQQQNAAHSSQAGAPQGSSHYATDHRLAKTLVCLTYILLGTISIETGNSYIALVAGTCIWFFGVNTVGYLIESVRGHGHSHHVL